MRYAGDQDKKPQTFDRQLQNSWSKLVTLIVLVVILDRIFEHSEIVITLSNCYSISDGEKRSGKMTWNDMYPT